MNTLVVITIGQERFAIEYKGANHRIIYRKTLRAISRNELFECGLSTHLKEVSHQKANFTELRVLVDKMFNCKVHIHTIED